METSRDRIHRGELVKSYNDVLAFSTLYFLSSGGGERPRFLRSRGREDHKPIIGGEDLLIHHCDLSIECPSTFY